MMMIEPLELVRREGLAIVWAKDRACRIPGWQLTPPFFEKETNPEAIWKARRAGGFEPGCTLRTSRKIGVEVDGPDDATIARAFLTEIGMPRPRWVETRPDRAGRAHLYWPWHRELGEDEKVSFRVEGGVVTAARGNFYRCVGGDDYKLARYDPESIPPTEEQYRRMLEWAQGFAARHVAALRSGEPLAKGSRCNSCFRVACLLFRWTDNEGLVADLVDRWQQATCEPALSFGQVAHQVCGAQRVRSADGDIGADLDSHRSPAGLTQENQVEVIRHVGAALAARWCDPELAAELALAYADRMFDLGWERDAAA
jgi:hypothetical protein